MINEFDTGMRYACPSPVPAVVQKSWNGLTTKPDRKVVPAQKNDMIGTRATRLMRSARAAIGTVPRTRATPPNPSTPNRTVSEIPRLRWMSGARTRTVRGSSSTRLSNSRRMAMPLPPAANASRKVIGSSPTPGRRSSGRVTPPSRSAWVRCRAASSSRTAAARLAALSSSSLRSRMTLPRSRHLRV